MQQITRPLVITATTCGIALALLWGEWAVWPWIHHGLGGSITAYWGNWSIPGYFPGWSRHPFAAFAALPSLQSFWGDTWYGWLLWEPSSWSWSQWSWYWPGF